MSQEEPGSGESTPKPRELRGLEKWVREESFWKDVTTRTLSGLVVVFVVWLVGLYTGVFNSQGTLEGLMRLLELSVMVFGVLVLVLGWRAAGRGESVFKPGEQSTKSPKRIRVELLPFAVLVLIVGADAVARSLGYPVL